MDHYHDVAAPKVREHYLRERYGELFVPSPVAGYLVISGRVDAGAGSLLL